MESGMDELTRIACVRGIRRLPGQKSVPGFRRHAGVKQRKTQRYHPELPGNTYEINGKKDLEMTELKKLLGL